VVTSGSLILGAYLLGGMLSPRSDISNSQIPGVMSVQQEDEPLLKMRFPRTGEGNSQSLSSFTELYREISKDNSAEQAPAIVSRIDTLNSNLKKNPLTFGAAKIARSFQLVFFPLCGLLLGLYVLKKNFLPKTKRSLFTHLLATGSILFILGWAASSLFELYGYYWELSKFLYIGSFLAMLIFGISLVRYYETTTDRPKQILIALLISLMLIGPCTEYFILRPLKVLYMEPPVSTEIIKEGDKLNMRPLTIKERYELLQTSKEIVGSKF